VKGNLLGAQQDAVMKLDDFPMAMLQPIFRAVPALQHAAPAVAAPGSSPPAAELLNRMNIPFLKCAVRSQCDTPSADAHACSCACLSVVRGTSAHSRVRQRSSHCPPV
jgi:hypothetical protein